MERKGKETTDSNKENRNVEPSMELIKEISSNWADSLTHVNLSKLKLSNLDNGLNFPPNMLILDLSHNNLTEIPEVVMKNKTLKELNLAFNQIQYFDATPEFCYIVERLNLEHNRLLGPPYWIWSMSPSNLVYLNLSDNSKITSSFEFENGYYERFLQHKCLVETLVMYNCQLSRYKHLLATFIKVKKIEIGTQNFNIFSGNFLESLPGNGLDQCHDVETLILSNTKIYTLDPDIDRYKELKVLDLAMNEISSIPKEFTNLVKLETCILSFNRLLYLPDDLHKMKALKHLLVDNNELCMVPEDLLQLPQLKRLDLYNNYLYEVPSGVIGIEEVDVAQNYCDEFENEEYTSKKQSLRKNLDCNGRYDGRKPEINKPESENSTDLEDDDDYQVKTDDGEERRKLAPSSSSEDWDSDSYWTPNPHFVQNTPKRAMASWLHFVYNKMAVGNFCPIDQHVPPIVIDRNNTSLDDSDSRFDVTDDDS